MSCVAREAPIREYPIVLDLATTAVVVVDMWDTHWCKTFTNWVDNLAPRINRALEGFREHGAQVIFMIDRAAEIYSHAAQYLRMSTCPIAPGGPSGIGPNVLGPVAPGRWPIGGCVCPEGDCVVRHDWDRMHPALTIEPTDLIGGWGTELHSTCQARGFTHLLYCGVATNMCVLDMRTFSMIPMVELGYRVMLLRDLTEAFVPKMYREEGLRLSVRYIERFIAPTILASQLLGWEETK
jgi:nicotinamidase-related amidase